MNVLVTGGSGFVGSHVVDYLLKEGYTVTNFDARACSLCPSIIGDLLSPQDTLRATQNTDAVCHLAAVGDVYLALEKPYLAAETNVAGTAYLLDACLANGVRRFLYASTWEVYGAPIYQPLDEDHPCHPDHPYNITKLAGEQIVMSYDHLKHISTVALRLGTAFGTRMRSNSVFSLFVKKALAGEPITIQGTGEQSRQFVHTRDVAKAFALALHAPARAEAFNIVPQRAVSIRELAEIVTRTIPTDIIYTSARSGDISPALVSAEKARNVLGWQPEVVFEEGLAEIIQETRAVAAV